MLLFMTNKIIRIGMSLIPHYTTLRKTAFKILKNSTFEDIMEKSMQSHRLWNKIQVYINSLLGMNDPQLIYHIWVNF